MRLLLDARAGSLPFGIRPGKMWAGPWGFAARPDGQPKLLVGRLLLRLLGSLGLL